MLISSLGIYALISCLDMANAVVLTDRDLPSLTVPLRRRAAVSNGTSLETFAAMAQNLRLKYNLQTRSLDRRQGTGVISVTDENADSSYSGVLSIGTPGQIFGVILDTGSSDLWLASTACSQGCTGATTYNPSSSSSFSNQNQPVSITYGSGAIDGLVATDTVSMGGFTVQSQTFAAATTVSSGLLDGDLSGLLGLGFKSIANTGATPFVQSLASGSSFSSPLMSFYLARFINNQNAQDSEPAGGIFTLGATNSSLFTGDIDFVNIPSTVTPGFWLLPVTGITVQGQLITVGSTSGSSSSATSQLAAIDTGTTLIGGPSDVVAAIYAKIPGATQGAGQLQGYWTYPCSTDVNISLTFGGTKSWPISPADFQLQAQRRDGSTVCLGALFDLDAGSASGSGEGGTGGPPSKRQSSTSTNPAWIIGDSFLKNVYSVFRFEPPSVGFAQLAPSLPGAGATPGPAVTGGLGPPSIPTSTFPISSMTPTARTTTSTNTSLPDSIKPAGNGNGASGLNVNAIHLTWMFGLVGAIAGVLRIW